MADSGVTDGAGWAVPSDPAAAWARPGPPAPAATATTPPRWGDLMARHPPPPPQPLHPPPVASRLAVPKREPAWTARPPAEPPAAPAADRPHGAPPWET
ncbi:MAG: hypothetical protein HY332_20290 [Chloroflexi bacterium]|nr:hypothetical protein [Chloroflexota bacterium]